jgi:hypothetical protein
MMTVAIDRKKTIIEIRELEENHCIGCELKNEWRRDVGNYKASVMCVTECKIGKKIHQLGDILTYGKPTTKARDLTEEVYLEMHESGKTDKEICEHFGIGSKLLKDRKRHWKIKHCHEKWTQLSVKQYKKYRAEGISDELVCQLLKWDRKTLHKFKERNGLIGMRPLHHVTHTEDGREMTAALYKQDIQTYKKDSVLSAAWGVNISTFERIKRRWRERGEL